MKCSAVGGRTFRLIPSCFPPIAAFEIAASADDLAAVMELEGLTNDRLVAERLARLPRAQWVFGVPNASVVMAAYLHAAPSGTRFSSVELGAWYAGLAVKTSIAEVAHHLAREAAFRGRTEMRLQYRVYLATLTGRYVDIRGQAAARPEIYAPDSYGASQAFGESLRAKGEAGIVYDSVRHRGGTNTVVFLPRQVQDVTMGPHFEITAPVRGKVIARTLP